MSISSEERLAASGQLPIYTGYCRAGSGTVNGGTYTCSRASSCSWSAGRRRCFLKKLSDSNSAVSAQ
jgi:hypothetical protein